MGQRSRVSLRFLISFPGFRHGEDYSSVVLVGEARTMRTHQFLWSILQAEAGLVQDHMRPPASYSHGVYRDGIRRFASGIGRE